MFRYGREGFPPNTYLAENDGITANEPRVCPTVLKSRVNAWNGVMCRFKPLNTSYGVIGAGLKYSYDSIIGPVELDLHWASRHYKTGMYLNIGLYF